MPTPARHIAGAAGLAAKANYEITVDDDGVWFGKGKYRPWSRSWDEITSLEVAGSDSVSSTLAGNVLAFGALGLLANSEKRAYYLVVASGDEVATFEVRGYTPFEATARLKQNAQAARKLRQPGADAAPPAAASIDGLTKLVELHDAGKITDEEFTAAKRTLLGLA